MKYILYILGFLLGIFILLSIMRFKYSHFKENKEVDKNNEDYYKLNIDSSDLDNNINNENNINIIEHYQTEKNVNNKYNDDDLYNLVNCNKNIIINFKISRLLEKKYLVVLLSSYIKENYDSKKNIWKRDNVKSIHFNGGDITVDGKPEYILSRLNPLIGGYNINNCTISILPVFKEFPLGAKWELIEKPENDFIEIISTYNNSVRYENLIKELKKGANRYIPEKIIDTFPKIEFNNFIKLNNVYYKPYIDDAKILKNITILFNIKLISINNNDGYLLYLSKSGEKKDLASIYIKIMNSNNIKINNITEECKNNIYCSKLINNIQDSINIHNNYYENNSVSNKEFNNFIEEQCNVILNKKNSQNINEDFEVDENDSANQDVKTEKLNIKLCEYIKNNLQDEYYYYNNIYKKNNYTIQININSKVYNIYDINQDIFETDNTFIGLIIKDDELTFHLNNSVYNFNRLDKENITPSLPFIINKNKSNNMILYSLAIFKDIICESDILSYKMYNNYYLNGINNLEENKNASNVK